MSGLLACITKILLAPREALVFINILKHLYWKISINVMLFYHLLYGNSSLSVTPGLSFNFLRMQLKVLMKNALKEVIRNVQGCGLILSHTITHSGKILDWAVTMMHTVYCNYLEYFKFFNFFSCFELFAH